MTEPVLREKGSGPHFGSLSLLAVGAFRLLTAGERDVLTSKLFHVSHYRSVFMNVNASCMPADGKLRKTTYVVLTLPKAFV